ncbi:hypothetical protein ACWGF3_11480 [Streptomyces xanthophaeus]
MLVIGLPVQLVSGDEFECQGDGQGLDGEKGDEDEDLDDAGQ